MSNLPKLSQSLTKFQSQRAQSTHIRTMQSLTSKDFLEITPQQIIFNDVQTNKIYEQQLTIRNLTRTQKRIRIVQPKTSKFKCDYDMPNSIASGLSFKVVVIFETNQNGTFADTLKIVTEENKTYEISLLSQPYQNILQYETLVNFGVIKINTDHIQTICIKNLGKSGTKVEIVPEINIPQLQILQGCQYIMANSEATYQIQINLENTGVFRKSLFLKQDGVNQKKLIDINATAIDYQRFLQDKNGLIINEIQFGNFYCGKVIQKEFYFNNNSAEEIQFKINILQGKLNKENNVKIISPEELGIQQTQRNIQCFPRHGIIAPFQKTLIKFVLEQQISEQFMTNAREFAFTQDPTKISSSEMIYTAQWEIQGQKEQDSVFFNITGRAYTPSLVVSSQNIKFGTCRLNEKVDVHLNITNTNLENAIDINFEKIPYIFVSPQKIILRPKQVQMFLVQFQPKKLGQLNKILNILAVKDKYKIPIQIQGNCNNLSDNQKLNNGLERTFDDLENKIKFVQEQTDQDLFLTTQEDCKIMIRQKSSDQMINQQYHKSKANQYLIEQRQQRKKESMLKQMSLHQKRSQVHQKLHLDNDEEENDPPQESSFLLKRHLQSQRLQLPKNQENLFVLKPIGNYEAVQFKDNKKMFQCDPNQKIRNKFPSEPKSFLEKKDSTSELNGEMLQKIFTGPKVLDFGNMNIKSTAEKTFHIRNDLNQTISIQLDIQNDELQHSYQQRQIINPGKSTGFDIILNSEKIQDFTANVKYTINGIHEFYFQVLAKIEAVNIESEIKLSFNDDSQELQTSENLRLTNHGNSAAYYSWQPSQTGLFSISPLEGSIKPGQFIDSVVTYFPSGNNLGKYEEEKLIMKIENGNNKTLKCIGHCNESKCQILERNIDLGQIPVCQQVEGVLTLKNIQKFASYFNIDPNLPQNVKVSPMKAKLGPDHSIILKSKEELVINSNINICFRGGKSIQIPFAVQSILPQILIAEKIYDFGSITTLEQSKQLIMTIINSSSVDANLLFNLTEDSDRSKDLDGIECLDLIPILGQDDGDENSIIQSVESDNESSDIFIDRQNKITEINQQELSDQSITEDLSQPQPKRKFIVHIKSKKKLQFYLNFMPRDVKEYQFILPIQLHNYGKLPNLQKTIICKGIKPKFIMRPQTIIFKKKVVMTQVEKCYASYQDIQITNPENKVLIWKIDCENISDETAFQINPVQGRIEGGQTSFIKIGFNPTVQGQFSEKLPLYLDNNFKTPYCHINLQGFGNYPRINFDRNEILLPVVPLNTPAVSSFYIINDGYDKLNLKHNLNQEYGNIDVEVIYVEGNLISAANPKLKIEVRFQSAKTISFTTKIEFYDEYSKSYIIHVSGTCDNSLMTNYQFIQRNISSLEIIDEECKPLQILLKEDISADGGLDTVVSQKTQRQAIGYHPLQFQTLQQSLDIVKKWLNQNVTALSQGIQNFPQDIIKHNGSQLFEIVKFLTNKHLNFQYKQDNSMKRSEKILALVKQYEDFLRYLKENGALLNTLRPHYLLNYQDHLYYLKQTFKDDNTHELSYNYISNVTKIEEKVFTYVSNDAWIQVFYQMMKIFYEIRVNKNIIRSIPNLEHENYNIPDYYLEGSNFISHTEGILMRWLDLNYQIVFKQPSRLQNLDMDLKDSLHFIAAISNYTGKSSQKYFQLIRKQCFTDEDCKYNCEKLINMLDDLGIVTHITQADLRNCNARDNIIFITHLTQCLPHYIPKGDPIEFECILGDELIKEIELTNSTNSPINYWVNLEGSSDFSTKNCGNLEIDCIKIDPKSKVQFKVKFVSRITISQSARLTFFNKKAEGINASALVFDLKSVVNERRSIKSFNFKTNLYKLEDLKIDVTNIFSNSQIDTANFSIQVINHIEAQEKPKNSKRKKKDQDYIVDDKDLSIPAAFFVPKDHIQIKKGQTVSLYIQFMPFTFENHKCYIIFQDPNVGEFQYEIMGETLFPDVFEDSHVKQQIYVDQVVLHNIQVPFKNQNIQNLRKKHENRLVNYNKIQQKEEYSKLLQSQVLEQMNFEVFTIPEQLSFLQIPSQIQVFEKIKKTQKKNEGNKIQLQMQFKNAIKDYQFMVVIKNTQLTDIRCFKVFLQVLPKPIRSTLEMHVSIGDNLKQDIPIINTFDNLAVIKATFEGDQSAFSGPTNIQLKKQQSGVYPLTFKPEITGQMEAKLTLTNIQTNDQFEYKLMGYTEEPLAADHIVIQGKAKQNSKVSIPIHNKSNQAITYIVETDLINPQGNKEIHLGPKQTKNYNFTVQPIIGGDYNGSITFIDKNNKHNYIWYTVLMETQRPNCAKRIEISTTIRKPIVVDINIQNPENEDLMFEVVIQGEGLSGSQNFAIKAGLQKSYELMYLPLKKQQGIGLISFMNYKIGEIWYEIQMSADEAQLKQINDFQGELGKYCDKIIELDNPSATEAKMKIQNKNVINFECIPKDIIIKPFSSQQLTIRYTPTLVNQIQEGTIIFQNAQIGDFEYQLQGIGLPPTQYEEQFFTSSLNKELQTFIFFKNPYSTAIIVNIYIENNDHGAFKLLAKKQGIQAQPNIVTQIPFIFKPQEISDYKSLIVVKLNDEISWKFPIRGVSELIVQNNQLNFQIPCRQMLTRQVIIELPNIPEDIKREEIKFKLANIQEDLKQIIQQSFNVKNIKNFLVTPSSTLLYEFQFEPFKPFKTSFDLLLTRPNGGQWKFRINLIATEPDDSDVIEIFSTIGKTSSVQFKLSNKFKKVSNFKAYFVNENETEFKISPKEGELVALGSEPKNFIISYTPQDYKNKNARLIIETNEYYWSFFIKGSFPVVKYNNKSAIQKSQTQFQGQNILQNI